MKLFRNGHRRLNIHRRNYIDSNTYLNLLQIIQYWELYKIRIKDPIAKNAYTKFIAKKGNRKKQVIDYLL